MRVLGAALRRVIASLRRQETMIPIRVNHVANTTRRYRWWRLVESSEGAIGDVVWQRYGVKCRFFTKLLRCAGYTCCATLRPQCGAVLQSEGISLPFVDVDLVTYFVEERMHLTTDEARFIAC